MSRRVSAVLRRWRSRRERRASLLVVSGLVGFVVGVYVVVVLGGDQLLGDTGSPSGWLSVLATALVAMFFEPVRGRLDRLATRVVRGGRPSPYDVLSRSAGAAGDLPAEELPTRMARVLAEGTGARWAQLWLAVGGRFALAATWPAEAEDAVTSTPPGDLTAALPGVRSLPVVHRGEQLGVLRLAEDDHQPLTPVEERLFAALAAQAGLVLRGARLRAELAGRLAELSAREAELRASRQRLIDTQDDERRRLERDIHDGAQQHLVALAVNLRLADTLVTKAPDRAVAVLDAQAAAAREAVRTLTDLSRGIYPPLLRAEGVVAALRAAVSRGALPVTVSGGPERYAAPVEAALYFCGLEAVQNATKHSGADHVEVRLTTRDGVVALEVEDDGGGLDPASGVAPAGGGAVGSGVAGSRGAGGAGAGSGLANMRDRLDAVGGTLTLTARPGGGVVVRAEVGT